MPKDWQSVGRVVTYPELAVHAARHVANSAAAGELLVFRMLTGQPKQDCSCDLTSHSDHTPCIQKGSLDSRISGVQGLSAAMPQV